MVNEARAPTNEKLKGQVLKEYHAGAKPKQLSEKTGISINTIKSWIKRDKAKKAAEEASATKQKAGAPPKRKKGAPVGNKNAEGHGAPERNQNAVKHGAYSKIYWDSLDDEELDMISDIPRDEEELLLEQIKFFALRERRFMKAIKQYKDIKGGLSVSSVFTSKNKRDIKDEEEKKLFEEIRKEKIAEKKISYLGEQYLVNTTTEATINIIQRLERELTQVQAKKTKVIDSLIKLRLEKRKMDESGSGGAAVDEWITGVLGQGGEISESE